MLRTFLIKKKTVILIFSLLLWFPVFAQQSSQDKPSYVELKKVFAKSYQNLESAINGKSSARLYNIQLWTNNLLQAAFNQKDYGILDSLSRLYFEAYKQLQQPEYYVANLGNTLDSFRLEGKYKMWLEQEKFIYETDTINYKREVLLNSTQFAYVVSNAINFISQLPERTAYMDSLLYYVPVLIKDHYERWIFGKEGSFQMQGWGCINGRYNHVEYLTLKKKRFFGKVSYCRAILDQDMWIMAGVIELLAAHKKNPELIPLADSLESNFYNYINSSISLIENRFVETTLIDFNGNLTVGTAFDLKSFIDHEDSFYANYTGENFPSEDDKKKIKKIGWDISHMRRFVQIVSSIERNKEITGIHFSDSLLTAKISNQFIYGIFNGDYEKPLFANYFDGQNGWYRVGYHGEGFGYGPSDLSDAGFTGGYLFWGKYNANIQKLSIAMWKYFNTTTPEIVTHREQHYGRYYKNGERTPAINYHDKNKASNLLFLLMYLPCYF